MNYAINLLPPHLRPKTGIDTKHLVAGTLTAVVLVCGGLLGWQLVKEQQATRELSRVTQEMQLLQPVMQQIQKNKALQAQMNARAGILAQIKKERSVEWSDMILQLGQATPDNLWLIQLSSDANGIVNVRGGANDIDTVSKYVDKLRQLPNISQVSFVGLVQANLNEKMGSSPGKEPEMPQLNVVTYDLQIRVKGGAQK